MRRQSSLKLSVLGGVALACVSCSAGSTSSSTPSPSAFIAPPSAIAATTAPAAADEIPDCPLTPDEVKQAMVDIVGPGAIVIDEKYTENDVCTYTLPAGSLAEPGTGGTVLKGTDGAGLTISTRAYSANYMSGTAVYDVKRKWGGSTPEEIIESRFIADRDTTTAQRGEKAGALVRKVPDIGLGAVSDGVGQFTVAGTGKYWYYGGIGGVKGSPVYEESILKLARALADKG